MTLMSKQNSSSASCAESNDIEAPCCSICNGTVKKILACSGGYDVQWCPVCSIGMTVPFPDDAFLCALYSTGAYRANDGNRFIPFVERIITFFRDRHRCRITTRIATGRILDIGCGRGTFLDSMQSAGWDVCGVEFSDETASYARKRYAIQVSTSLAGIEGLFDVVTLNHVIEHVQDPVGLLAKCHGLLKDGGVLFVAAPNIDSLQAKFGGAGWFHLDVPRHLYHFSESGLVRMIESGGFTVERIRRFDFEHNPFGWMQTLFNRLGFRHNALYEFLKSPGLRQFGMSAPAVTTMVFVLIPIVICAYLLAIVEAVLGAAGTVEVRAVVNKAAVRSMVGS